MSSTQEGREPVLTQLDLMQLVALDDHRTFGNDGPEPTHLAARHSTRVARLSRAENLLADFFELAPYHEESEYNAAR